MGLDEDKEEMRTSRMRGIVGSWSHEEEDENVTALQYPVGTRKQMLVTHEIYHHQHTLTALVLNAAWEFRLPSSFEASQRPLRLSAPVGPVIR